MHRAGSNDGGESSPPERIGEDEEGYELIEDRLMLARALSEVDGRRREMLKLRFVDELPARSSGQR